MLDYVPYRILIPIALWMAVAPISPQPHLIEKINMLREGTLTRPIDIFDLTLHSAPLILLAAKLVKDYILKS